MAENIQKHFQFLRSADEFTSFDLAKNALIGKKLNPGEPALAYYAEDGKKKALLAIGGQESGQIYFYNSDKIEELIAAAEARVNATIKGLGLNEVGGTGQVITTISQTDGKVSATAIDLTAANVAYNGEGSILSATTKVNGALKALETAVLNNKAAELTYKTIQLTTEEVTALGDANVKEAYKTVSVAKDGTQTNVGDVIKIYKDSSLKSAEFVGEDDKRKKGQFLKLTYILATGNESVVYVDMSALIEQSEVENGIQTVDGKLSIKLDNSNESKFLTVGADGLKLSGVQDAINTSLNSGKGYTDNLIASLNATVTGTSTSTYSTVKIDEANGKLTAVTITDTIGNVSANKAGYAEATDVKAYVDNQVSSKNVAAEGDTYVSATAGGNKVTVKATEKLTVAVDKAETALQSVTGTPQQITVTEKANGSQTISFAADAVFDCGEF